MNQQGITHHQLPDVAPLLEQLAAQLEQHLAARGIKEPLLVGIHTGGVWVAEALRQKMQVNWPLGSLDISFYRDDYSHNGLNPSVKPSNLPFATEDRHLVLVDDVLMSGRTIRAALNEIFDFGRPASVTLVTLLALPGRELPIQPDCCGQYLELPEDQRIKLSGPSPLQLNRVTRPLDTPPHNGEQA
ncbi:bifunctional pyr operon transcriptional regulator/uracil phosphoribosyltransferase PyrR [Marinospirillum alkaliphilum]|uniref:Pyrimidine operon attenuation protein / uracil phosphoribosyltransferase n=1 Tax=Marinospirillum alkaliphilum DSM 21637 TaxID=1122209 RepID=A0A1K1WPH4_9GAMM|nr:bifunctional pyr operon transcriptional regulator/uracil phosphoribosyltransferase PyrR [Marinospirillum alkaliphilum]SFX39183.1 pyrimidine operon attenuation protein / uracil phosphoribosyltransferase [Marinospirillum alkaliphilum DSM 21637]